MEGEGERRIKEEITGHESRGNERISQRFLG